MKHAVFLIIMAMLSCDRVWRHGIEGYLFIYLSLLVYCWLAHQSLFLIRCDSRDKYKNITQSLFLIRCDSRNKYKNIIYIIGETKV